MASTTTAETKRAPTGEIWPGLFVSESSPPEGPAPSTPSTLDTTAVTQQIRSLGYLFDVRAAARDQLGLKLQPFAANVPGWKNFVACGDPAYDQRITCKDCSWSKPIAYCCNKRWCPSCGPKLANRRARIVQIMGDLMQHARHVVLTARNEAVLTRRTVRKFQAALVSLRRSALFKQVRGGTCALEVTNEGRGWHLHAHLLLDVRYIDSGALAIAWAKRIGQAFAIVKVQAVQGDSYAKEVAKYIVKGTQLAGWEGEHSLQFIRAMHGTRAFVAFGSAKAGLEFARRAARPEPCSCEKCASTRLAVFPDVW